MNPAEIHDEITALRLRLRELRARLPAAAERNAAIVEAVKAGATIAECAAAHGLHYASAGLIIRAHEKRTGERLPRAKRGPPPGRLGKPMSFAEGGRNLAIVASYRETHNLQETGKRFGLTSERVRQIIVVYERAMGELIPRDGQAHRQSPRVRWVCAGGCGAERWVVPSVARAAARCQSCAARARERGGRSRLTDALIEETIARVLGGSKWMPLAVAAGYSRQTAFALTGGVYRHLIRTARHEDIARLWPRGVPNWLHKFDKPTPEFREAAE